VGEKGRPGVEEKFNLGGKKVGIAISPHIMPGTRLKASEIGNGGRSHDQEEMDQTRVSKGKGDQLGQCRNSHSDWGKGGGKVEIRNYRVTRYKWSEVQEG